MALAVYVLAAVAALAQPGARGRWIAPRPDVKGNLTRAEADALKAKVVAAAEVLRDAALPLEGYDAVGAANIVAESPAADERNLPVAASVSLVLRPRRGGPQPGWSVLVRVNSIDRLTSRTPYLRDEAGPMYVEPPVLGQMGGYPVYESNTGRSPVVALARGKAPLLVAVSRERVLRARIGDAKRLLSQIENLAGAADAAADARKRLEALEAELAAMPPAERSADAYIGATERPSGLSEPNAAGARRLVTPNPKLFDPNLPRAGIYVMLLGHPDDYGVPPQMDEIRRKVDLGRLEKLID